MQDYRWDGQWQGPYGADNYNEGWNSSPNQYFEHQGPPNYYQPNYGGEQQEWSQFGQQSMLNWNEDQYSPSPFRQDSSSTFYHQSYNDGCPPFQN
ncbi:hypothetical protein LINGRAHAP2_LOCUS16055, partial [Linum grandiflorum]